MPKAIVSRSMPRQSAHAAGVTSKRARAKCHAKARATCGHLRAQARVLGGRAAVQRVQYPDALELKPSALYVASTRAWPRGLSMMPGPMRFIV